LGSYFVLIRTFYGLCSDTRNTQFEQANLQDLSYKDQIHLQPTGWTGC